MVSINYSAREVCCKIVYYGPGLSGKTTNLQYVHSKVPQGTRGKLISLATEADRTLYFDFLPINIGTINDFQAKFQLYTVPGQVYYNATRKLVLRGVDGVVFVADSQADKMDENIESLANLEDNLTEYGYDVDDLPLVIQYNKRDLPGILPVDELNARLNQKGRPFFEASATQGRGVFDTLKLIIRLVLERAKSSSGTKVASPTAVFCTTPAGSSAERVPAEASATETEPATAQPATVGSAASAPPMQTTAAAEADSSSAYRPYPGSERQEAGDATTPPTGFGRTMPDEPRPDSTAESLGIDRAESQTPITVSTNSLQMAPSLRRRRSKKRSFFKRLFGMK